MANEFTKEFEKCPVCALKEWIIKTLKLKEDTLEGAPFFGDMVKDLKESGLAKEDWNFALDSRQGPVASKEMLEALAIGEGVPAFSFKTDICSDCGCIWAYHIERGSITKDKQKADIVVPNHMMNRADRRRASKNGEIYPPLGG